MRAQAVVTSGRWVRLLLLCCTLVGLAAMHTLGHGAHAGDTHPAAHPTSAHLAVAPVAELVGMVDDCPAGDCGHAVALPLGDLGGHLPGWGVCVAVLGAFGVALLVAVLLRAESRVAGPAARGAPRLTSGPRSPPPRPFGQRLAAASVLRR